MNRYACAVCGKRSVAERMVYSRHTGRRFCRDWAACDKRARRSKKKAAAVTTA